MGDSMCKTACVVATVLAAGCADPGAELTPAFRPPPDTYNGTNGGPAFSADELINVMEGNGHLNSSHHQRYEAKARDFMQVPPGYITEEVDQELVGAMLGALTNVSGQVVRVQLVSQAFGDHPTNQWRQEDRASQFS